jgi:hypothetical protein
MSDPAVEAAKRLLKCKHAALPGTHHLCVQAANEALSPLRIAHAQMRKTAEVLDQRSAIRIGMTTVLDDLARFIYPTNNEDD